MSITPLEKAADLLDKVGLDYALLASTLLGIYRDGNPIGNIQELAVLRDDLTDEKYDKLKRIWRLTVDRIINDEIAVVDLAHIHEDHMHNFEIWMIYFQGDFAYQRVQGSKYLVWPKSVWEKSKWKKITWRGRKWNMPAQPEKYLSMYYGDWRKPQPFHWSEAKNIHTPQEMSHLINT